MRNILIAMLSLSLTNGCQLVSKLGGNPTSPAVATDSFDDKSGQAGSRITEASGEDAEDERTGPTKAREYVAAITAGRPAGYQPERAVPGKAYRTCG